MFPARSSAAVPHSPYDCESQRGSSTGDMSPLLPPSQKERPERSPRAPSALSPFPFRFDQLSSAARASVPAGRLIDRCAATAGCRSCVTSWRPATTTTRSG